MEGWKPGSAFCSTPLNSQLNTNLLNGRPVVSDWGVWPLQSGTPVPSPLKRETALFCYGPSQISQHTQSESLLTVLDSGFSET